MSLTYDELKLGEKAKENFLANKPITENAVYLNTRPVFANLHATDLAIAAVLGGLPLFLPGRPGCGKTQLAFDIYRHYFGSDKNAGGQGVLIRGRDEIDIYREIFTSLNIAEAEWKLTDNCDALVYLVDEINRCATVQQNQFLVLGDGLGDYKGRAVRLGKDGYSMLIATANLGNGEHGGTFQIDSALYSRLPVAMDFDYEMFQPTEEDSMLNKRMRPADHKVKHTPIRDISDKILLANKEIQKIVLDPGDIALAALSYLEFGLKNCMQVKGAKEKVWPMNCPDCKAIEHTEGMQNAPLCTLIKAPAERTLESTIKYAASLQYLSNLKDPSYDMDTVDLVFKAFELTCAYQGLLNPYLLRTEFQDQNPKMMAQVVERLKDDFRKYLPFIETSLAILEHTDKVATKLVEARGKFSDYDSVDKAKIDEMIKRDMMTVHEPFTNDIPAGMGWMGTYLKLRKTIRKTRGN
jgi:hypothetical protein